MLLLSLYRVPEKRRPGEPSVRRPKLGVPPTIKSHTSPLPFGVDSIIRANGENLFRGADGRTACFWANVVGFSVEAAGTGERRAPTFPAIR